MKGIYRVHSVKLEHIRDFDDPFRFWDEDTFNDFESAKAAFDRCTPINPSIHREGCIHDSDFMDGLPLVVFLTFTNMTFGGWDSPRAYHIDKGIGVIERKTVYPAETTAKREYQGAI